MLQKKSNVNQQTKLKCKENNYFTTLHCQQICTYIQKHIRQHRTKRNINILVTVISFIIVYCCLAMVIDNIIQGFVQSLANKVQGIECTNWITSSSCSFVFAYSDTEWKLIQHLDEIYSFFKFQVSNCVV